MPEYDGKVHIFTGIYWGFLVAYLGGYSTFLAGTVWFLIVTYYTQPTYQTIIKAIASTFYDRVIASSLEKIIDELASSGVTDFITGVVLFGIAALKSILGAPKTSEKGQKPKASTFRLFNVTTVTPSAESPQGESLSVGQGAQTVQQEESVSNLRSNLEIDSTESVSAPLEGAPSSRPFSGDDVDVGRPMGRAECGNGLQSDAHDGPGLKESLSPKIRAPTNAVTSRPVPPKIKISNFR